jgi:hypothetical protein
MVKYWKRLTVQVGLENQVHDSDEPGENPGQILLDPENTVPGSAGLCSALLDEDIEAALPVGL